MLGLVKTHGQQRGSAARLALEQEDKPKSQEETTSALRGWRMSSPGWEVCGDGMNCALYIQIHLFIYLLIPLSMCKSICVYKYICIHVLICMRICLHKTNTIYTLYMWIHVVCLFTDLWNTERVHTWTTNRYLHIWIAYVWNISRRMTWLPIN